MPDGGYDSSDDVEGFDEEEYANLLREFAHDAEDGISLIAGMHDDEDDYTSQLDHVDPVAFFLDTLNGTCVRSRLAKQRVVVNTWFLFSCFDPRCCRV